MICQGYQTSYLYTIFISKSEQKGVRWVVGGGEGSLGRTLREDRTERRVISSPLSRFPLSTVLFFCFNTSSLNFYYYFIIVDDY